MPTILRIGPYRFFFYASDGCEPMHIHVEKDDQVAKYWLDPVRLQASGGFSRLELKQTKKIIAENQKVIIEAWNDYFGR